MTVMTQVAVFIVSFLLNLELYLKVQRVKFVLFYDFYIGKTLTYMNKSVHS